MKALKFIFWGLLALVFLAAATVVVLVKTVDVNRFKSQLTEALNQQLNTDVEIDDLGLNITFAHGVTAQASGVNIKDFPGFSSASLFIVDQARLDLDILPLLTRGEFVISSILLEQPQVKIVRNKEGRLNVQQFAGPGELGSADAALGKAVPLNQKLPRFLVKDITFREGKFTFIDNVQSSPLMIAADKLTVKVRNFSLEKPFDLFLQTAVFSPKENLEVTAQARIDLNTAQFRMDDVQAGFDLGEVSMDLVEEASPGAKLAGLYDLKGKISLAVSQMVVGKEGLQLLAGKGQVDIQRLGTKFMVVPVEDFKAEFDVSERDVDVQEFTLRLGNGGVSGKARLDDYLKRQKFAVTLNVERLAIQQVIPDFLNKPQAMGTVAAKIDLAGEGLDPVKALPALKGAGQFSIQDGKLGNVNILNLVLSRSPVLAELLKPVIEGKLPARYKTILAARGTVFGKISCVFKADKGVITVDKAEMDADVFALSASGTLDQKMDISVEETLALARDISTQIVAGAPELKALQDERGRVAIPMKKYSGPLAEFKLMPDAEAIARNVIVGHGKKELQKILEKVLPKSEDNGASGPTENNPSVLDTQGTTAEPQPIEEQSPEKQIIGDVFDQIFK